MKDLRRQLVLITGASSGIGAATALKMAEAGAHVVLLARNSEKLAEVAQKIIEKGGKAWYFAVDISNYSEVISVTEAIKSTVGIPDILINNAGAGQWRFIEETGFEEVNGYMAVPFFGAFYLTKSFLPDMKKRGSGHIVNMTSYAAFIPFSGATAYIAARKAMVGFHEALTADLYYSPIKTSLVYFAKVKSSYWENNAGSEERLPRSQVLIPPISPERAAAAIVRGLQRGKSQIYTPGMVGVINAMIRYFPRFSKWLIHNTGYYLQQ